MSFGAWFGSLPMEKALCFPDFCSGASPRFSTCSSANFCFSRANSPEFARLWEKHEVHVCKHETTSLLHPSAGRLDFDCDVLFGDDRRQRLLVLHPRNDADLRKLVTAD